VKAWVMCQGTRKVDGVITYRTFPFYAPDISTAQRTLKEMPESPWTHLWVYGHLIEHSGRPSKIKKAWFPKEYSL